jgi:hypothetical protein
MYTAAQSLMQYYAAIECLQIMTCEQDSDKKN